MTEIIVLIIIIIIIIIISSIKTIEPMFSIFLGASCFDRYGYEPKNSNALLTNIKYSSAWFGDMPVEAGRCLSGWYIRDIFR